MVYNIIYVFSLKKQITQNMSIEKLIDDLKKIKG